MKKLLGSFIVSVLLISCCFIMAFAEDTTGTYRDFEYQVEYGEAIITNYVGSEEEIVIPSEIDGHNVTIIGDDAFYFCSSITKVTIPNTIISIESQAFRACQNLREIIIPENVAYIGINAFSSCTNLQTVYYNAKDCTTLDGIFTWCPNLSTVIFGDTVTVIPEGIFTGCETLTNLSLSKSITIIGEDAFYRCTSLAEVVIPENITYIGYFAFGDCTNLQTVYYNAKNCITTLDSSPFVNCTSLSNFIIGNGVKTIPPYLGSFIESLTNLTISNSVTSIGECAFVGCRNLTELTLPESVTHIGGYAFKDCTELQCVYYNAHISTTGSSLSLTGCTKLTKVVIGDGVETIPSYTFWGNDNIVETIIPESVIKIGVNAFSPNSIIYSIPNAYARQYAIENDIKWVDIGAEQLAKIQIGNVIRNNNVLTVTINVMEEFPEPNGLLIVGIYSSDSRMLQLLPIQMIVPGQTEYVFDMTGISPDSKIKVFAWHDMNSLIPLCEPKQI